MQMGRLQVQKSVPALRLAGRFAAGLLTPVSFFTAASFFTAGRLAAGDLPGDLQVAQALRAPLTFPRGMHIQAMREPPGALVPKS